MELRTITRDLIAVLLTGFWLAGSALAAPPTVLQISPKNGDMTVNPKVNAIRIEFDQDMHAASYSLCGGGPSFPAVMGQVFWETPRICVVPVRLEKGREYQFSVNCPSFPGFRNPAGEAAEVLPVTFRTLGETGDPSPVERRAQNRAALATIKKAIDARYSYRDRVIQEWSSMFSGVEAELLEASSAESFALAAGKMLAPARDPHLFFRVDDDTFPTFQLALQANADLPRLRRAIPGWKPEARELVSGRFKDGTGYLLIGSWQGDESLFEPLHKALDGMLDAKSIIIDVRFNAGGDERIAQAFAARFVPRRALFAKHRVRDPESLDGWTPVQERYLDPAPEEKRFRGKVAVLMGPRCFSSNESFLLMMRHAAGAKLIGEPSYGSSGNPQPYDLGNGVTFFVPSWQALEPDGSLIEGAGIQPDIHVPWERGGRDDSVLEAALRWIRGLQQCRAPDVPRTANIGAAWPRYFESRVLRTSARRGHRVQPAPQRNT